MELMHYGGWILSGIIVSYLAYKKYRMDTAMTKERLLTAKEAKIEVQILLGKYYGNNGNYLRGGLKNFHPEYKEWCQENHLKCKVEKSIGHCINPNHKEPERYTDVNLLYHIFKFMNQKHNLELIYKIKD